MKSLTRLGFKYTLPEPSNNYRFGFNGQMKDDDISGAGNHNTALYWEYDTRLGRRWNLDPVRQAFISQYACFDANPIWKTDFDGDFAGDGDGKAPNGRTGGDEKKKDNQSQQNNAAERSTPVAKLKESVKRIGEGVKQLVSYNFKPANVLTGARRLAGKSYHIVAAPRTKDERVAQKYTGAVLTAATLGTSALLINGGIKGVAFGVAFWDGLHAANDVGSAMTTQNTGEDRDYFQEAVNMQFGAYGTSIYNITKLTVSVSSGVRGSVNATNMLIKKNYTLELFPSSIDAIRAAGDVGQNFIKK